jgi:hypothetical protein
MMARRNGLVRGLVVAAAALLALVGGVWGAGAYRERVVAPAERAAVLAGMPGWIAVPLRRDLWRVAANGSGRERLTVLPQGRVVTGAAWAPSGDRLAVSIQAFLPGRAVALGGLYLLPAGGGELAPLLSDGVPGALFEAPTWTPDGSALVYAYQRLPTQVGEGYAYRIERVGAAGTGREVLVEDAHSPGLSADGRRLAYVRRGPGGAALLEREVGGADERTLVPAGQFVDLAYPRFAVDGEIIAFAGAAAPAAGGRRALLMPTLAWAHGLPWDLWVVRRDGTGLRRLTDLSEDEPSIAWSPDGRWLALHGARGLYLVEAATGRVVRLADGGDHGRIDWAP